MDITQLYSLYRKFPIITTDSRDCPPDSIFFALKGDNFDGNKFAVQALQNGCAFAVVDDALCATMHTIKGTMIYVPDTSQAFKDLAREHRRQFDIPVIAITGTNGKTTTKELVRSVLAQRYNVLATEGNFNNDVGVPKTLLRLTPEHEIAVVEMGASHPGDIRTLAETAEPTCGLITNVGKAHLQGFGSLDGVIATKGELYDNLAQRHAATIFVNKDDDALMGILPGSTHAYTYSRQLDTDQCDVRGEIVACDPYLRLRWRTAGLPWSQVATRLIGSYNLDNVLAAIAVGLHFDVKPDQINQALAQYAPSNNRSQLSHTARNHLIIDAYNANPTSMAAAIDNFALMAVTPKMAIIGEMRELGTSSRDEHQHVVDRLENCGFEQVWLVGEAFADIECGFRKFADVRQVQQALRENPVSGHYILIKGSNGTRLFELPECL